MSSNRCITYATAWLATAFLASGCTFNSIQHAKTDTAMQVATPLPPDEALDKLLDEKYVTLSVREARFETVLNSLAQNSGMKLTCDWIALGSAGIDRATPVTATFKNTTMRSALTDVLKNVGGGAANLAFIALDDGVLITTSDQMEYVGSKKARVYDVRDLLALQPDKDLGATTNPDPTHLLALEIVKKYYENVWDVQDNLTPSIQELPGQLVITQTKKVHQRIAQIIEEIRVSRQSQPATKITNP